MRRHFRWSSLPELPEARRQEAGGLAHFTTVGLDSVQMAGWDSATLLEAVVFAANSPDVSGVVVGGRRVVEQHRSLFPGEDLWQSRSRRQRRWPPSASC